MDASWDTPLKLTGFHVASSPQRTKPPQIDSTQMRIYMHNYTASYIWDAPQSTVSSDVSFFSSELSHSPGRPCGRPAAAMLGTYEKVNV